MELRYDEDPHFVNDVGDRGVAIQLLGLWRDLAVARDTLAFDLEEEPRAFRVTLSGGAHRKTNLRVLTP